MNTLENKWWEMAGYIVFGFVLSIGPSVLAQEDENPPPLVLEKMGVMFVGGREVEMATGGRFSRGGKQNQIVEQAPVHFLIPPKSKRRDKHPVVMIPGMGLTSYLYLGTPDGRDGWAQIFAKAGYPVYVFDEPNNAISGFEISKFSGSESPRIMLWSNEMTWRRWGIGPEPGVPAKNTRFPVKQIGQLHASMTAVMGGGGRRGGRAGRRGGGFRRGNSNEQNQGAQNSEQKSGRRIRGVETTANPKVAALAKLLEKIGPSTIIMHSASGPTGFEATRLKPKLVKNLVAVEVTGSPNDSADIKKNFANKRFIGIYGDNFDLRPMQGRLEASQKMAKVINDSGGKGEVIWLPKLGINGNSHLLMLDNNNEEIAKMIMKRLGN